MKHSELVDRYDMQVDSLEEQLRARGLTEEQTEPFFFELRKQTYFFARLDNLDVDTSVQDELYDHYLERQTTIERWIDDMTYALKYGFIMVMAGVEATDVPHEVAYLNATMSDGDIETIRANLLEALGNAIENTDNEILAGKLDRFAQRLESTSSVSRDTLMPVLKRVAKLVEPDDEEVEE